MGLKSLVYAVILVAAMATLTADAQGGVIGTLLGLIHIEGTLYCTVNGNIGDLGQATPVFPSTLEQAAIPKHHLLTPFIHVNFTLAPLILYFSITTLLVLLFRYYFPSLSKIVIGSALPLILLSIGTTKMMFAIATKEINLL